MSTITLHVQFLLRVTSKAHVVSAPHLRQVLSDVRNLITFKENSGAKGFRAASIFALQYI